MTAEWVGAIIAGATFLAVIIAGFTRSESRMSRIETLIEEQTKGVNARFDSLERRVDQVERELRQRDAERIRDLLHLVRSKGDRIPVEDEVQA